MSNQPAQGLLNGESFLEAVFDVSNVLMLAIDPAGRIVWFNHACERVSGYTYEEVKGRTIYDTLVPAEDRDMVRERMGTVQAGDFPADGENIWVTKDGQYRHTAWSNTAIVAPDGSFECFVSTGIDITERKEAERALRLREAEMRSTFDDAPVGMLISDLDGSYLRVNPAVCELLGHEPEELLAMTWRQITHPDDLEANGQLHQEALDGTRRSFRVEKRYLRKDGEEVPVLVHASLVLGPKGAPFTS